MTPVERMKIQEKLLAMTVQCRACGADIGEPCKRENYWPALELYHISRYLDVGKAKRLSDASPS